MWLFPLLTDNADEGAYLAQAASLRAGQLLPDAPTHPKAYHPWFSAIRDGHYVYKYTPVHASVLATAGTLFGSERAALAIIAAAVIVLLGLVARELGARPGAAALACVAFACSPVWLLQSVTFLPYCEALAWLLAFLWCFLRGFRLQSTWWLVGAGGFAGLAFLARPFEGAVFVAAVVVYKIWTERGHGVMRPLAWCALGALPGALLLLAYNWYATGNPLLLAFQITGRSDAMGFGIRHVLPTDPGVDYTIGKAFSALANNMLLVITWTFGS
ncbi:MAG TPA: glycosyltransferase family 39 protein, partial [Acidimicrobiia bacterium]|nr:glycosyltransferase family 39 protein [Acidimicrobiia bacterium]